MLPPFERKEQRMNNDKFVLTHGIWKGTDKNASSSSVTYHDSYNDAVKEFKVLILVRRWKRGLMP